ncbi:DNA repair protein RecO [Patescibacteria group bacterium]|nr:DNA repair protein RecO [Patescibacteria group bacterium]
MKKYNIRAVVLKSVKYKDSDKIFTLLTKEQGKISAIARGVRKISSRRSGNLDTLNLVLVKIHEDSSGFKNIEEVRTIESFKSIKKNLDKSLKAYYISELVYRATEEDNQFSGIFELLVKCLKALDKNGYSGDLFVTYFEIRLMKILGYQLTLDKCGKCGINLDDNWKEYRFNIENGSIECEKCSNLGIEIPKNMALALDPISNGKFNKDFHKHVSEIDKIMKMYIGRKIESKFKSLEIDTK